MRSLTFAAIQFAVILLALEAHCTEAPNNEYGTILLSLLNNFNAPTDIFSSWNASNKYPCHWEGVTYYRTICELPNLKELYLGALTISLVIFLLN
ncbi:hypothetical protein SUGI_0033740 [Cryptomeria japonica]|nr:hypothetical protein SUGI_0033740 [Cryptomeria japonica]